MFRKFADRVSAAASNAFSTSSDRDVQRLTAMGFDRTQATQALHATNGNVDQAAELLLASAQTEPSHNHHQQPPTAHQLPNQQHRPQHNHAAREEEELRRALEASLEVSNLPAPAANPQPQKRTAAMQKAAEAAEARNKTQPKGKGKTSPKYQPKPTTTVNINYTNNGAKISAASRALAVNHPGVKVIPKLQDKSIEEQILRCADRLKSSPAAVDTLYKACVTIQQNPQESKYRTIDTSAPGFQRSLAPAPGALDFLKALNFQSVGPHKLVLSLVDPACLFLGVSALEQTKLTPEYVTGKQRIQHTAELAKIHTEADHSEEEALKRAAFLAKCPTEPPEGRGAWIQVALADHETIRRRFDADDTLQDVLYWMAASHGSILVEKLRTREWMLQDLNRNPAAPLDCVKHSSSTLQYLGCWPSGRLELVVSTNEWKSNDPSVPNNGEDTVRGSARGLGAAPKEAL